VQLDGGWILNHFGEEGNSYLGYLVLATKEHRAALEDLSSAESRTLGINLTKVIVSLKKYWQDHFDDRIERVHVAYLNEGPFIHKNMNESHVHFHMLPRTKEMMSCCAGKDIGWCLLYHVHGFPDYLRSGDSGRKALMLYLKQSIGIPVPGLG